MLNDELSRYLEEQLLRAMRGEDQTRGTSPEAEKLAASLRGVLLEAQYAEARSALRSMTNAHFAITASQRATCGALELAAAVASDVVSLARLVEPHDAREAQVVQGAVDRARRLLGPVHGEKH